MSQPEPDQPPTPPPLGELTPERAGVEIEDALSRFEWDKPWKRAFLAAFARTLNVAASARIAGVSVEAAYKLRRRSSPSFDPVWAEAWAEAEDVGVQFREQVADRLAFLGEERVVTRTTVKREISGGKLVVVEEVTVTERSMEKSPRLQEFLLRAHRPEKYRERRDVRLTPAGDAPPDPPEAGVWREPTHERMLELAEMARELEAGHPVVEGEGRVVDGGAVGTGDG